jgi:hypothetical protein
MYALESMHVKINDLALKAAFAPAFPKTGAVNAEAAKLPPGTTYAPPK